MCRLIALSREETNQGISKPEELIFGSMLALSSRAGNLHGCGISTNNPDINWLKIGTPAEDFVFEKDWKKWWDDKTEEEFDTIVGHTRLASLKWRNDNCPTDHAHPHHLGRFLLFHNGEFKESDRIAKELKIDDKDLIDTQVFLRLLEHHNQDGFTSKGLVAALKHAGEAEYSMIIKYEGSANISVVCGNRSLFVAESNYGLLLNTQSVNINDLKSVCNYALRVFGYPILEIETPKSLDDYTLYRLRQGQLEKLDCFEEEVKEINKPKTTYVSPYQSYRQAAPNNHSNEKVVGEEIGKRAEGLMALHKLLPKVPEEHHRLAMMMLYDHTPDEDEKYPTLLHFESEQLQEYIDLMTWAHESGKVEDFTWSEEKYNLWMGFTKQFPDLSVRKIYTEACHHASHQVDIPYFLTSEDILQQLEVL